MSYYMGDPRQMYGVRGDPGFFKSILGLGKRLIGAVLPGGGGGIVRVEQMGGRVPEIAAGVGRIVRRGGAAIARHPVLSAAGAAGAIGVAGTAIGRATAGGAVERGFHISKKTGALVRNRRMRVTNPRALRRAIRRATGFARLARRVLHFTSPRAPRGRAIFKRKRHKRV